MVKAREQYRDVETITEKLMKRRLELLSHLARMPAFRMSKICLFGWLHKTRPPGGLRRMWSDLVKNHLKRVDIDKNMWYDKTLNRYKWLELCRIRVGKYH